MPETRDGANPTPRDWQAEFLQRMLNLPQGVVVEMYMHLREELTKPPNGWDNFGTNVDWKGELQFWGTDDGGMPIWEKRVPPKGGTNCVRCGRTFDTIFAYHSHKKFKYTDLVGWTCGD